MNLSLPFPLGGHQEAQEVADFSPLGVLLLGCLLFSSPCHRVGGSTKHTLRQESLKKYFETTCSDLKWDEGKLTYKASFGG